MCLATIHLTQGLLSSLTNKHHQLQTLTPASFVKSFQLLIKWGRVQVTGEESLTPRPPCHLQEDLGPGPRAGLVLDCSLLMPQSCMNRGQIQRQHCISSIRKVVASLSSSKSSSQHRKIAAAAQKCCVMDTIF